jgi:hypothetical protein
MTVEELSSRMSYGEFERWKRYEAESLFLSDRVEMAGAMVSSTVANVNRGKGQPPYDVIDFAPFMKSAMEEARLRAATIQADNEDAAILQRLVLSFGGSIT